VTNKDSILASLFKFFRWSFLKLWRRQASLRSEIKDGQVNRNLFLDESCERLQQQFYSLETPKDVAKLLAVPYSLLVYYLYRVPSLLRYKSLYIAKKAGGSRLILIPATPLKIVQRKLNQVLQCVYKPKPSVHGFVPGKSIVTNAKAHSKKRYVLNIDLKNFFPSINFGRVRGMFIAVPYDINPAVATILAQICCHDNQLPQGAPTSPVIANMICAKMDSQLQRLAKECRCTYTRYADDLTFSTTLHNFPETLAIIEDGGKVVLSQALQSIINGNGFTINERKVWIQIKGLHQEVTGLTVNKFPNVDRKYVRQIRAMLHAWEKYGIESAEKEHRLRYASKRRSSAKNLPDLKQIVHGKIEFLGMVRGKDDALYQKYLEKYLRLSRSGGI
jgi:RNA-directed DNA polymerase